MKKELLIPILILALTIAFAVVSAMVFLNGGKSEKLIRRKLKLATLLLTFNAMIWGAKAQEGEEESCYLTGPPPKGTLFLLGPDIRVNSVFNTNINLSPKEILPIIENDLTCPGFSVGLFTYIIIGNIADSPQSINLRINYSEFNGEGDYFINNNNYLNKILDGNIYKKNILKYNFESSMSCIDFKLLYSYFIFENIRLSIGPGFIYFIKNNLNAEYSLNSVEVTFKNDFKPIKIIDNNTKAVIMEGKVPGSKDALLNLSTEVSYDIITGLGYDFTPYIGFCYNFSKVTENNEWTLSTFYYGISCRIKFRI
jgi:hypothetical protein